MSSFLLYHPRTRVTGRVLAAELGIPCGGPRTAERRNLRNRYPDVLIRWGSSIVFDATESVVNTRHAIARAADKLATLVTLSEAGVRVPEFSRESGGETDGVWLARRRYGQQGRDIRIIEGGEPLVGGEFYTRYIPNTREYRVHVFDGEVIRVQGKYLDHPDQQQDPYVKNYLNGYRFRTPSRSLNPERLDQATRAVEALGLDFGAADVVKGEDGLTYVLEVNTAPACSPLTLSMYADRLRELIA